MIHKSNNSVFKLVSPHTADELLNYDIEDLMIMIYFANQEAKELEKKLKTIQEEFTNFQKYPLFGITEILWDEKKIKNYIRKLKREYERAKMTSSYLQGIIRIKQKRGKNG